VTRRGARPGPDRSPIDVDWRKNMHSCQQARNAPFFLTSPVYSFPTSFTPGTQQGENAMSLTRNARLLFGSASLVLAGALAIVSATTPAAAQDKKTLVISWWGFNGDKLQKLLIEPFKAECKCEVVFETGNNADRLNKIKIRGGGGVDIVYLTDAYSQIGIKEGLFLKLDRAKIPNLANLYDIARDPQGGYGPAYTMGRIGIIYDAAKVKPPIASWSDLWRSDLKASVSLPGITTTAGPATVWLAGRHAGVDAFTDPDGTFKAIAALKPAVVKNYNTGSELVNLFSTGEITTSLAQDFTLGQVQKAVPTAVWADLKEGDIATLNTINVAKNAANPELAYQFINYLMKVDVQQALGAAGVDAPVAKDAKLTPAEAKQWVYGAEMVAKLKTLDYDKLNAAKSDWGDRWNEVFGN
jgi:putative spermidine/putrescine transport system substrate-binding protein